MNKSLRGLRKPLEFHKKAKENIRKTNDKKKIDEKTLLNKKINKIYLMVAPPKKNINNELIKNDGAHQQKK